MIKIIRHGDLGLVRVDALPEGLKASKSKEIIKSSGGNSHSIDSGTIFFCKHEKFDIGFLVAKNTTLLHPEHGAICGKETLRKAKIKDGVYGLIGQKEDTNSGMKRVID